MELGSGGPLDHTTPANTVARETCNEEANMVVVKPGHPRWIQWL